MRRPYVLARLAGAQPALLQQAPADRVRAAAMGGVLLTTAGVAGVSATFALVTAVGLPLPASIAAGVLWAWVIFNLDRMLVVSMIRQSGLWRNVLTIVPRVLLAVLIGAVISVPLVLRIFQPEINDELLVMRNERFVAAKAQLDERFQQIPQLEQQEAALQAQATGQVRPDVAADPEVTRLQGAYDAKTKEYDAAEQNVVCENDGTCGSGQVGRGPSYREKVAIRDRLSGERDALKRQLDDAVRTAQARIDAAASSEAVTATSDLGRVQAQLAQLRQERAAAEADVKNAADGNTGLLARLEALNRLSAGQGPLRTANITLGLLFVAIELLPVIVKLLTLFGPKTHYDTLVDRQEDDLSEVFDRQVDVRRQRARLDDDAYLQIAQHRSTLQVDEGKAINDRLVAEQSRIAQKAIDTWAQIAAARSDDELRRWYAQQTGTAAPAPGAPAPAGSPTTPARPGAPTPAGGAAGSPTLPLPRGIGAAPAPAPAPASTPPPASASPTAPIAVPAAAQGSTTTPLPAPATGGWAGGYRQFKAAAMANGAGQPQTNGGPTTPTGP